MVCSVGPSLKVMMEMRCRGLLLELGRLGLLWEPRIADTSCASLQRWFAARLRFSNVADLCAITGIQRFQCRDMPCFNEVGGD